MNSKYDSKFDTNILKLILSFNNVNSLHISNNINEKQICVLMAKNNELRKINWVNEFKMKVEKKIHNEKCKQKLDNVLIKLLNHINFIFQNEQISFPDNDIIYINSNALYFYIDITNYGVFLISIINDNNIWIYNICEPEHILDEEFIIDPNNITYQCIILNSDYYLKKTFKKGTINEIINAIWFTPFWKKRMPDNNNYIVTY